MYASENQDTLLGERTSDVFSSVAWGNDSEAGVDAGCATALARFGTILIVEPIRGHVAGFLGSCGITDGDERVRRMDYTHLSIGVDVESLVYPVATLVPVELQSVQAAEEGIVAALEWHGKVARPGDVALAMGVAGAVAPRSEFLAPSSTALFRDERRLSEDADQDDGSNGHDDGGGVEPTEVYSTTAVRMTPEIAGGFIVAFTLLFILGVILWCLMSVQAPDRFVSKPLPAGKEF